MTDAYGRVVTSVPPNVRCIHGHFPPDVMLPQFPDATLITWVREPVERVISSYYHRLRAPDWQHPVSRELHEKKLSLVEFAALDLMRNEIARFFGSKEPEDFAFIGLTETFEDSLARFLRQFGFAGASVIPRENCNPERRQESYSIDEGVRKEIARLNENDCLIYEACQRHVHSSP
jgi:hypothetical protein